jgi:predicted Zn finger-like uncharacterized protein
MLIVCPNCETPYEVSAASLGAEGRQVRCVRCRKVWFATPPAAASDPAHAAGAGDQVGALSAAASAYQRGAAAAHAEWDADDQTQDQPAEEDAAGVDANLAARAADRTAHRGDDSSGFGAVAADGGDALATHDAPPLAPVDHTPGRWRAEDIESVAARRARRAARRAEPKPKRRRLALVIVPLLLAHAVLILWRTSVVRAMPQTAPLFAAIGLSVNLRGVAIANVTTVRETSDNVPVLVVQGTIANISRITHEVPRLRLALRNAAGAEVYTWTALPNRPMLGPGEVEEFQTRLASPPVEGRDLVVRFFTRRDLAGGAH